MPLFDTVEHNTLLSVLHRRFGVWDPALSWVKSYLSDRTVNYLVNRVSSGPVAVNCSVPQGSVLGPIKFISYTLDISTVFHWHWVRYHLYADNKQAYTDVPVQDVCLAKRVLQDCISVVANWCSSRRLQLNASKTELIWFGSRQQETQETNWGRPNTATWLQFRSPVSVVCDLVVMMDCELSMKQHVTHVASSCFYHLRQLKHQASSR